jgi:hypothetical protein
MNPSRLFLLTSPVSFLAAIDFVEDEDEDEDEDEIGISADVEPTAFQAMTADGASSS